MKFRRIHLLWFISLIQFIGCETLSPYIRDFNIISVPQEIQLGNQLEEQVAKEMPLSKDASKINAVSDIGNALAALLPRKDFTYQFFVVDDKTPNAFTIPGGHIYVHTGLLDFVDNTSQLAGVLAHEIGHAYERHPTKGLSRAYGIDALTKMIFKDTQGQIRQMTLGLAKGGILTRYTRDDEREADDIAFYLLKRSSYAPEGLLNFLKKLQTLQGAKQPPAFLSTHPPTVERITRLEALIRNERSAQFSSL